MSSPKKTSSQFVLVMIDFPDKVKQSNATKKQNEALAKLYSIAAFPTLLLLDPQGRPYAEGDMVMEVDEHVAQLRGLAKKRLTRDKNFAAAEKLGGIDKAKAFHQALTAMGLQHNYLGAFYKNEIDALAKNDPDDKTGFVKMIRARTAFSKLALKLEGLYDTENYDGMIKAIDEFIKAHQPDGAFKQEVLIEKLYIFEEKKDFAAGIAVAEEILKIDPDSDFALDAKEMKRIFAKKAKKKNRKKKKANE